MTLDFEGRHVIVTGGAGLIGSFLVEHLVKSGAKVTVVDDFSKGKSENLIEVADRIMIRRADLENKEEAAAALIGADIVFHLASRAYGVGYSSKHHYEMLSHNERITNNVLDCLRRNPPKQLLVTSSSCVYSDDGPDTIPELPLFVGEPEKANWGYGWAKRFLEQKALIFSTETGTAVTIVRPFNIYGERYRWVGESSQAIPMLVKRILDGTDPVIVWGSGNQRRNYLHAIDCAWVMAKLVAAGHHIDPVNIGTEDTIAVIDLARLICRQAGITPKLAVDATKPEGRFIKSASSLRLRQILPNFQPSISLEDGIRRMIDWYHATFQTAVS